MVDEDCSISGEAAACSFKCLARTCCSEPSGKGIPLYPGAGRHCWTGIAVKPCVLTTEMTLSTIALVPKMLPPWDLKGLWGYFCSFVRSSGALCLPAVEGTGPGELWSREHSEMALLSELF